MLNHKVYAGNIWILLGCVLFAKVSFASEGLQISTQLEQGGLAMGKVPFGYKVRYAGNFLKTTPNGTFVFGLGRDAPNTITLSLIDDRGINTEHQFGVKSREYKVQSVTGVPQRTVTPSQSDVARIRRDSALVKDSRRGASDNVEFLDGFKKPLEGPVTGVYGSQRIYNGVPKSPHYGVDYAASTGTLVFAPAAGEIKLADADLFYSGGTIVMEHGFGLTSSFLHLSEILVSVGQKVEQGAPIGKVGATGRSTGPHLDWRMNWLSVRIDPQLVMQALPAAP
jgi:murein DD-endopeptidase MepM/ murein hydrolase activator NlpD|tara:strand:+ start:4328 stop:5170 length:843 start_codon:yes stop_codon:yes gene_type:complete